MAFPSFPASQSQTNTHGPAPDTAEWVLQDTRLARPTALVAPSPHLALLYSELGGSRDPGKERPSIRDSSGAHYAVVPGRSIPGEKRKARVPSLRRIQLPLCNASHPRIIKHTGRPAVVSSMGLTLPRAFDEQGHRLERDGLRNFTILSCRYPI